VTVRFVCGYGSTAASVPSSILAAMKLLTSHWYDHRNPVDIGNVNVSEIPLSVNGLLWPYRAF
jgi:uncharacterized phiE125 gp8 family phage protein